MGGNEMIKQFISEEKTALLVSCVVVSLLGFFVHIKMNHPVNFESFFTWLPVSWLMVGVLGISFKLFLGEK